MVDLSAWLPFYPDLPPRAPKRRAPALAAQPPYTTDIFPVPDVLASLTFAPSFPDRVPRRCAPEGWAAVSSAWDYGSLQAVSWRPTFPDRFARAARLTPESWVVAPSPVGVIVAQSLAWRAVVPDRGPHRRLPTLAGAFWTIPPEIPAAAVVCVTWAQDAVAQASAVEADLSSPAYTGEGLAQATFTDEDLC